MKIYCVIIFDWNFLKEKTAECKLFADIWGFTSTIKIIAKYALFVCSWKVVKLKDENLVNGCEVAKVMGMVLMRMVGWNDWIQSVWGSLLAERHTNRIYTKLN